MILSGQILIGAQRAETAGALVDQEVEIKIKGEHQAYVSRGGLKLEAALREFQIQVNGKICADLGASTGGFTDCLLKHGAARVHAFDVGKGQLDWRLRQDPRVVVHDDFNVRNLTPSDVGEPVDLMTLDLSFISLTRVLPALRAFSAVEIVALVKPQFEARREEVGPGGIIRSPELQAEIVGRVKSFAAGAGFELLGETPSPIPGQKGNREFLLRLKA
ncbi:MAG: TlyA family RNA methyltransferase [Acidobacteriota bacterium]